MSEQAPSFLLHSLRSATMPTWFIARSLSVRLCCKNKTDDHRELNYLTGVTNTMCSKHYYYTLPLL